MTVSCVIFHQVFVCVCCPQLLRVEGCNVGLTQLQGKVHRPFLKGRPISLMASRSMLACNNSTSSHGQDKHHLHLSMSTTLHNTAGR